MPNLFDLFDPSTVTVAPDGKNTLDAPGGTAFDQFGNAIPLKFAKLPGNIKLSPLQQVQMQSLLAGTGIDPENAGATLQSLLQGNDDVFLQSVAPYIAAAPHALLDNPVTRTVGKALDAAGKVAKGGAEASLFWRTGQPQLAAQQVAATASDISPAVKQWLDKQNFDTSNPYEDAQQTLSAPERIASNIGPSLLQSAPQLALTAVQPELGALSFGFTPQGFDPVQAGVALIAPGGGKLVGGIAEKLAAKAGISDAQALGLINRLGGGAGMASLLSAPTIYQISQMKPGPERDEAVQDAASNAILTGFMGSLGAHGTSPEMRDNGTAGAPENLVSAPATDETFANGIQYGSQDTTVSPPPVASKIFQQRFGTDEGAPGPARPIPTVSEPHYVLGSDETGGLDHETTQAGIDDYLSRQRNVPPVQIVNDPNWTHNGYGVRGSVQNGRIIVNRAFIDSDDTLQKVLGEEHNHVLLSSDEGRAFIRLAGGSNLGDSQFSTLARQYPRQEGESAPDWKGRLMDEFIAKAADENIPLWQRTVERVKAWLAGKGIGQLSDEETARAIMRALKSGETAAEFAPRLLDISRNSDDTGWGSGDESDFSDSPEEEGNVFSRYNLTKEPLQGMSMDRTTKAINELLGTKQLPAAIRVFRDHSVPDAATVRPRGAIAVNAAQISTPEEAGRALLSGGLGRIWYEPDVQRAWQRVRDDVTSKEVIAEMDRRKAGGLPTDPATAREEIAIARVMNSDGRTGAVGSFHYAIRGALKDRFNLNLPATARPQLKDAAIQFLHNRIVQPPGLGLPPKGMIPLGQWGEDWLSRVLRGEGEKPSIPLKTSLTFRYIDRKVNRIAHESKAGLNVKLHDKMRTQILKDADLIRNGDITGAHWHFFQGAQPDVLKFLEQNGIGYTVY